MIDPQFFDEPETESDFLGGFVIGVLLAALTIGLWAYFA